MVCTHGVGLFAIMALLLGLHRAHFTYASSTVPIDEDTFDFSRYSKEIPRMARPFARKALNLTEEELKNMHPMDVAVLAKDKMESLPSWMASRFDIPPPEVVAAWERKKAKEKAKKEAEEKAKKEAEEKAKKEAEEKAKKEAEEAAKKKAEEAAKKKAEEAKKKAEEAAKKKAEEAKKKAEEAKKKAEEKAKKEAEEGTESEYEDAKDEFEEAKDKFEEAKDKFESAKETFEEAVKEKHELAKKRYEEAKEQFEEAAKEKYEEAKKRYEEAKEQYEEAKEEVKEEVEEVKEEVEEKEATSVAVEPLAKTSGALEYADALRGLNLWVPVLILSCLFLHYYKHFCRHCRGDRSTKHQHCCQPDSSMPVSSMVADSETDSKPSATTVLDEAAKVDILSPSVVQPGNQ